MKLLFPEVWGCFFGGVVSLWSCDGADEWM